MGVTVTQIFKSGLVVLNGPGVNLVGIPSYHVDPNNREFSEQAAGQVTPSYEGVMESMPSLSITVFDIGTLIANGFNNPVPVPISSGSTITSVDVYATNAANLGTNAGSGAHMKFSLSNGLAILRRIQGRTGQTATAEIELHACSVDGTTNPLTMTTSVSLPTTPVLNQLFTLGQLEIAASPITDLQQLDLDMGFSIKKEVAGSDIFPTYVYADRVKPEFSVALNDASQMSTYTMLGTALGSSSFVGYYAKLANMSTRVANATAAHIKCAGSASQGMIFPDASSLQSSAGEYRFKICPLVGTSAVLALSVAAIT